MARCGASISSETIVNLFLGNEVEGGPANIYLRRADRASSCRCSGREARRVFAGGARGRDRHGPLARHCATRSSCALRPTAPAWFWHVSLANESNSRRKSSICVYAQDVALAPYGTVRMNEYYVSQYVDHTPLTHDRARRRDRLAPESAGQRASIRGASIGSLRKSVSYATDALQFHGLATRAGKPPVGLVNRLSGRRLQHEHSMVVLQDEAVELAPGTSARRGFFGLSSRASCGATDASDLEQVDRALQLARSEGDGVAERVRGSVHVGLAVRDRAALERARSHRRTMSARCSARNRRHEEVDQHGKRLSFFTGAQSHVVLRAKELHVERPHGHLLRTGRACDAR